QAHDRLDQDLVSWIGSEVSHEIDVDLQIGNGYRLQVGEAAKPGAEVIEGELTAEPSQPMRNDLSDLDVLHQRRLGDLKDKVCWIGVRIAQFTLDQGQKIEVADR